MYWMMVTLHLTTVHIRFNKRTQGFRSSTFKFCYCYIIMSLLRSSEGQGQSVTCHWKGLRNTCVCIWTKPVNVWPIKNTLKEQRQRLWQKHDNLFENRSRIEQYLAFFWETMVHNLMKTPLLIMSKTLAWCTNLLHQTLLDTKTTLFTF